MSNGTETFIIDGEEYKVNIKITFRVSTHKAEDVMSLEDYSNFAKNLLDELTEGDIQYDCANLPVYVMTKYFESKGVELNITLDGITYSSSNPKYKLGDWSSNKSFISDLFWKINTPQLSYNRFGLTYEVGKEDAVGGDILVSYIPNRYHHAMSLYSNGEDNVTTVSGSGNFLGFNNPFTTGVIPYKDQYIKNGGELDEDKFKWKRWSVFKNLPEKTKGNNNVPSESEYFKYANSNVFIVK